MERSDRELLAAMRTDQGAFEVFYRRHVHLVTAYATRRSHRPEQVADLVTAVFLEVLAKSDRYDHSRGSRGTAVGWLLGITVTLLAEQRRVDTKEWHARRRLAGQRLLDADDYAALEAQIDASRLAPALAEALSLLPDGERELFDLVSLEGMSVVEASHALGIAPAAGRMRLARARRRARVALARWGITAAGMSPPRSSVAPPLTAPVPLASRRSS